jgi:hypothetical protein
MNSAPSAMSVPGAEKMRPPIQARASKIQNGKAGAAQFAGRSQSRNACTDDKHIRFSHGAAFHATNRRPIRCIV